MQHACMHACSQAGRPAPAAGCACKRSAAKARSAQQGQSLVRASRLSNTGAHTVHTSALRSHAHQLRGVWASHGGIVDRGGEGALRICHLCLQANLRRGVLPLADRVLVAQGVGSKLHMGDDPACYGGAWPAISAALRQGRVTQGMWPRRGTIQSDSIQSNPV